MNPHLQPLVGYGWSDRAGDHILNADEQAFEARRTRSRWWRSQATVGVAVAAPTERHGPPTWTITAPAEAQGEQYHDSGALNARTDALHRAGHAIVSYRNNL